MRLVEIYRARYDGRTEEALAAATERIRNLSDVDALEPGSELELWKQLMHLKGDCYLDLGHYAQAEECFDQVYSKTRDAIALSNRGYSRWRLGRLSEAKQDYLDSLSIDGDDEEREVCLRNLSELCIEMGELDEADKYLGMAREIVGDSFEVMDIQRDLERARQRNRDGNE